MLGCLWHSKAVGAWLYDGGEIAQQMRQVKRLLTTTQPTGANEFCARVVDAVSQFDRLRYWLCAGALAAANSLESGTSSEPSVIRTSHDLTEIFITPRESSTDSTVCSSTFDIRAADLG